MWDTTFRNSQYSVHFNLCHSGTHYIFSPYGERQATNCTEKYFKEIQGVVEDHIHQQCYSEKSATAFKKHKKEAKLDDRSLLIKYES